MGDTDKGTADSPAESAANSAGFCFAAGVVAAASALCYAGKVSGDAWAESATWITAAVLFGRPAMGMATAAAATARAKLADAVARGKVPA